MKNWHQMQAIKTSKNFRIFLQASSCLFELQIQIYSTFKWSICISSHYYFSLSAGGEQPWWLSIFPHDEPFLVSLNAINHVNSNRPKRSELSTGDIHCVCWFWCWSAFKLSSCSSFLIHRRNDLSSSFSQLDDFECSLFTHWSLTETSKKAKNGKKIYAM